MNLVPEFGEFRWIWHLSSKPFPYFSSNQLIFQHFNLAYHPVKLFFIFIPVSFDTEINGIVCIYVIGFKVPPFLHMYITDTQLPHIEGLIFIF